MTVDVLLNLMKYVGNKVIREVVVPCIKLVIPAKRTRVLAMEKRLLPRHKMIKKKTAPDNKIQVLWMMLLLRRSIKESR